MSVQIINADVLAGLARLADESVQCVVTSPPYWGLRDYGVEGQIGLEPTPELFVARMVEVFREVRRVLRKDGTLWLNLGDSYCSTAPGTMGDKLNQRGILAGVSDRRAEGSRKGRPETPGGMKPKDLVGIPWMTAFALRADGWWLRQEIIWSKPNPMPESVRDRCTKAHEHIFLLTKSERYFYDGEAIREESVSAGQDRGGGKKGAAEYIRTGDERFRTKAGLANCGVTPDARNKRSVWTMATTPYADAHFATFPEDLPETCIKAGSRPGDTILDPFGGAGTTGLVADKLGRNAILIELNPEYAAMAEKRIIGDCPMFASVSSILSSQEAR